VLTVVLPHMDDDVEILVISTKIVDVLLRFLAGGEDAHESEESIVVVEDVHGVPFLLLIGL